MEILVKQNKITDRVEYFGTEPSNFNLHFSSFCFPKFLIEVLRNKCFIFNRIANFIQNLQVEDFVKAVGKLSHSTTCQTNVAADSQSRLADARRICSPLNLALCPRNASEGSLNRKKREKSKMSEKINLVKSRETTIIENILFVVWASSTFEERNKRCSGEGKTAQAFLL
jgi:hypothetical protein